MPAPAEVQGREYAQHRSRGRVLQAQALQHNDQGRSQPGRLAQVAAIALQQQRRLEQLEVCTYQQYVEIVCYDRSERELIIRLVHEKYICWGFIRSFLYQLYINVNDVNEFRHF